METKANSDTKLKIYCNSCAFNGQDCLIMNKRQIPCWAKCTNKEELNKRYNSMLKYSISRELRKKVKKEYITCLRRLEK